MDSGMCPSEGRFLHPLSLLCDEHAFSTPQRTQNHEYLPGACQLQERQSISTIWQLHGIETLLFEFAQHVDLMSVQERHANTVFDACQRVYTGWAQRCKMNVVYETLALSACFYVLFLYIKRSYNAQTMPRPFNILDTGLTFYCHACKSCKAGKTCLIWQPVKLKMFCRINKI